MKPALSDKSLRYPKSWQEVPNGAVVKQGIEDQLSEISRQFFGYHLVKLGSLSAALELPQSTIKHRVNQQYLKGGKITSDASAQVIAKSSSLPYQENSIDTFILSHELDYSQDPHQVLREVDRCVIADGHVVITGFNPFSYVGVAALLPFKKDSLLHDARFFPCLRVKDWLHLLGYEIIFERKIIFSELIFERKLDLESPLQKWMQKYIGFLGSVYVLVAKKREYPLSLIKPKWKQRIPKFSAVGASMKESAR
jgi:SAM-dependent methyltransferase